MHFGSTIARLSGLLALGAVTAWGQSPGEIRLSAAPYTLPPLLVVAQSNNVPVTVVVRDRNGKVIRGLAESRFYISDNGQPQTLVSFREEQVAADKGDAEGVLAPSSGHAAPRYVALLFDDVNSTREDLMEARRAALRFLHEQLGPGDRMALFTVSHSQSLFFTQDRQALAAAIAQLSPHPRASSFSAGCPSITPYEAYRIAELHDQAALSAVLAAALMCGGSGPAPSTALLAGDCGLNCTFNGGFGFSTGARATSASAGPLTESQAQSIWQLTRSTSQDTLAAVHSVVDVTAAQPGQRIVVLASSGFLSGTLGSQEESIEREALRAGVVINALDATGTYADGPGAPLDAAQYALPLAARVFEETLKFPDREAQADAMASLAQATGGLYFRNNNDLTLGLEQLGLAPQDDYAMAFVPTPLVRNGALHQLQIAIVPPIEGASIEARRGYFAPLPGLTDAELAMGLDKAIRGQNNQSGVAAQVKVAAKPGQVQVRVQIGVSQPNQRMTMLAGLFNAQGFVTGERGEMDLALLPATFDRLRNKGVAPSFILRAPAGPYRLRVVVQDRTTGALATFNQSLTIP